MKSDTEVVVKSNTHVMLYHPLVLGMLVLVLVAISVSVPEAWDGVMFENLLEYSPNSAMFQGVITVVLAALWLYRSGCSLAIALAVTILSALGMFVETAEPRLIVFAVYALTISVYVACMAYRLLRKGLPLIPLVCVMMMLPMGVYSGTQLMMDGKNIFLSIGVGFAIFIFQMILFLFIRHHRDTNLCLVIKAERYGW